MSKQIELTVEGVLPQDADRATLVGRIFDPNAGGPCVVVVDGVDLVDVTHLEPTMSTLLEREDIEEVLSEAKRTGRRWQLAAVCDGTETDPTSPHLLAPNDLQVVKACGVTFVESMLERVIEERAKGDSSKANEIRGQLADVIGGAISSVRPGSPEAAKVKEVLQQEGLWSQYLEVGIGPDPEVFTKAPVLSSVGTGQAIGVLSRSSWNNPEPEVVLAVRSDGKPVGATLGNDVNLRDFEGRSALLLTEAKDNNASSAIGPFIRLFDAHFTMADVRALEINLTVRGSDGFALEGFSSMKNISRDPAELVTHAWGDHHQYPDGFMLYTGTLFSPTQDRKAPGAGFTHERGDIVRIATPQLGALVNHVEDAESAPKWTVGIWGLVSNLRDRQLI